MTGLTINVLICETNQKDKPMQKLKRLIDKLKIRFSLFINGAPNIKISKTKELTHVSCAGNVQLVSLDENTNIIEVYGSFEDFTIVNVMYIEALSVGEVIVFKNLPKNALIVSTGSFFGMLDDGLMPPISISSDEPISEKDHHLTGLDLTKQNSYM